MNPQYLDIIRTMADVINSSSNSDKKILADDIMGTYLKIVQMDANDLALHYLNTDALKP